MTATAETSADLWAVPAARLLLPVDAPREQWLEARRLGLGGSDASTVAGINPRNSCYALWLDKTGRAREKEQTDAMEWGLRLEPAIAQWFTDVTGIPVRRAGLMQSIANPFQQVSLDGMTADGGIAEWKTTSWRTEDAEIWLDGDVPDHAEIQTQHGMAVTGRSHAHVAVLIDGRTPLRKVVERDDELIAVLTDLERDFWHAYVLADVEPPVDGSEATTEALKQRYATASTEVVSAGRDVADLREQLIDAKQVVKDAEARVDEIGNVLRAKCGTATDLAVMGEILVTLHQNGTFNKARFAADHPDLVDEFTATAPVFDLPRLKTERPDLYQQYRARVLRTPKPKPAKGA
jgi:putative phage-type endonuclease